MGAEDPRYTEAQVAQLSESAVAQRTGELKSQLESAQSEKAALETDKAGLETQVASLTAEKADLENRVEVAEAAQQAAESARDAVTAEFEEFKNGLAELAEQADRKDQRVDAIKAAAPHLPEAFFEDEKRQTRWAEMADEQFDNLLDDFRESAMAALTPSEREAVEKASDKGEALVKAFTDRKPGGDGTSQVRETSAFKGGNEGGERKTGDGSASKLSQFLGSRSPVAVRTSA